MNRNRKTLAAVDGPDQDQGPRVSLETPRPADVERDRKHPGRDWLPASARVSKAVMDREQVARA